MAPPLPHHLEPLAEGWSIWRWGVLRAPGFPANGVEALAVPEGSAAVDRLLELPKTALPGERSAQLDAVQASLDAGAVRASAALRGVAGSPRFREALAWQNRGALHGTVDALLRRPAGAADSQTRRHERLVALYLQRYCVKNETIGFFGPVGWVSHAAEGPALTAAPGPGLLDGRSVYFEYWCIDALARRLGGDPRLRPQLAPRRMPAVRMEGSTLCYGAGKRVELPVPYAALFLACDGERPAQAIAREAAACGDGFSTEEEALEALAELHTKGLVAWGLDLSTSGDGRPERALRAALLRAEPCPAREDALSSLDALERARDAAARAAGDAPAVDRALGALEDEFTRLAGVPARRSAGMAYAGRTPVYEDCRRAGAVQLGPELRVRLAPPLALVLQSARWFTHAIAERYRSALLALHRELRQALGTPAIELGIFWQRVPELFPGTSGGGPSIVSEVVQELAARWARLLGIEDGGRRIERSAAELRGPVRELFAAPCPGWPSARYHSPDVLVAAGSVEEIQRGRYLLVLGELHAGLNTVLSPMFLKEHPDPEALVRARELDLPDPCIAPVWSRARSRADVSSPARHDVDLEDGAVPSWRPRSNVVPFAELQVELAGDERLVVRTRDGSRSFDVIAFLEQHLIAEAHGRFSLLPPAPHTPRVSVDGMVLARERWQLSGADIPVKAERWQDRFVAVRGWARAHGLPRCVMVRVPEQPKPVFLDLTSPVYVEIFAGLCRQAAQVTLTEMLPGLDELWLTDAAGERYTSELRFAALDPEPWRAP